MDTQQENNNAFGPPEEPQQPRSAASALVRPFRVVKLMLVVYMVSVVLYNAISQSFPQVICQLPIISGYPPVCVRELDRLRTPILNPDFITLSRLQSRLEDVLKDSASSPMAADCIKGSARDLLSLVGHVKRSSLARKDSLGEELEEFVKDAKNASKSIQELSSRVWGLTDRIISFNDQILAVLESSKGSFSSVTNFLLVPFGWETTDIHRRRTEGIWLQAIDLLDRNLENLINRTEDNVDLLERLEERLSTIRGVTEEEEENTRNEERESKREWFPDEKKSESRSDRFKLLLEIRDSRQRALNQVTGMLYVLNDMSSELSDLRERTGESVITAGLFNIPIEVHIKSIQSGTERLLHGQTRAREIKDANRKKKHCSKLQ